MDLWGLQVKDAAIRNLIFSPGKSIPKKFLSGRLGALEIRFVKRKISASSYRSLVVKANSKKSNDDSSSSGDASQENKPSNDNKSGDSVTPKSFGMNMDWREFRANLFMKEQEEKAEAESEPIGLKWAHPIPVSETGCVLVATEKLDGIRTFERTVFLIIRAGTRHPEDEPFGVVINRPLHKKIKHMKSTNPEFATTFSECSMYYGGSLEARMFLVKNGNQTKIPGFEDVMPGLNFGDQNSLDEASLPVKKGILEPHDFRFFAGYAGW